MNFIQRAIAKLRGNNEQPPPDNVVQLPTGAVTYEVAEDGMSILCLRCNRRSYNTNDVAQLFCGGCGFHEPAPPTNSE